MRERLETGQNSSNRQLRLENLCNEHPATDRLLLQGLYFGIIDEADSVLIDEAVTPLIISSPANDESKQAAYEKALALAETMILADDFVVYEDIKSIGFTPEGVRKLEKIGNDLGGMWKSKILREELVDTALRAQRLFLKDRQYLVADGKVQIIDKFTGRVMPDRSWEGGLH